MEKLTPMMAQYKSIKSQYQDCILMFRMGDFYEMFFEDAVLASQILQIALTSRNKSTENKAPMCGVPYHAVDQYLQRLTKAGKKVAICDQMTEPTGKGIVEREVVRVVTPGTTFDESILDKKTNNYVACIVESNKMFSLSYADLTTGDFRVSEFDDFLSLKNELERINPAECICDETIVPTIKQGHVFPYFYTKDAESSLKTHFEMNSLKAFGLENHHLAIQASGMLYEYLRDTQKTELKHIQKISFYERSDFMPLDESCIRNLEIFYTSRGNKNGSLIATLDSSITPMGGRMLRNWILTPRLKKKEIDERLNKVDVFYKNSNLLRELREVLKGFFDIERIFSRLSLGTGNARDLISMKESLKQVTLLKNLIKERNEFHEQIEQLHELNDLIIIIEKSIKEDSPISLRDGGIIKTGFNNELDALRSISTEGKTFIKNLQEREIKRTGIASLKVKFNRVFGYYIEISNSNLKSVPDDYMRKQTLVNAERFITPELKEYEEKVLTAEDKIKELEYELFYGVRMEVIKELKRILEIAKAIAEIDCYSSFAFNAEKHNYCKPIISEEYGIKIKNGRHPVIETINSSFVPNDLELDNEKKILLITGPNMGGKSTYLRQIALIVLMAQIGSFVPAESAVIGLVDRIFTRVGASDNLSAGESTFLVEMQETSYILNHATERSLLILDEVGRGTSTYDGVSIAWAMTEFIHDQISAKTLFATHYHELIELADKLPNALNVSVAVRENDNEGVVFLYKIVEGGIDKSYGIEVAKLAGLPVGLVSRARGVLKELESKRISKKAIDPNQTNIFESTREHSAINESHKLIIDDLENLDINDITPLEALHKLDEIKKRF
jgi:DNA mismatch repair protein MutS